MFKSRRRRRAEALRCFNKPSVAFHLLQSHWTHGGRWVRSKQQGAAAYCSSWPVLTASYCLECTCGVFFKVLQWTFLRNEVYPHLSERNLVFLFWNLLFFFLTTSFCHLKFPRTFTALTEEPNYTHTLSGPTTMFFVSSDGGNLSGNISTSFRTVTRHVTRQRVTHRRQNNLQVLRFPNNTASFATEVMTLRWNHLRNSTVCLVILSQYFQFCRL